ncbi:helix-turn-helix domain-containing protein [Nocardiopsis sp. FR26]|uniref:helix-turn-helix domain-containing protein n=1 Tax=Nocardiopsis sp. FR26 TaxID=2605987 RepID=UPI001F2891B8|nr:helix-turn-helix domain-containing protein [Nocardiopsis sp. FR26]
MSRLAYERAIRRSGLPAPARHLALTVATWADITTGIIPTRFMPSVNTLVEATGQSKPTVKRHLKILVAEGWMIREERRTPGNSENDISHTTLTIPPAFQVGSEGTHPHEVGSQGTHGGVTETPQVGSEGAQGGVTETPKSSLSSRSTHQSPRAGASEDRTGPSADRRNGMTKNTPTITEQLDAAADAARRELTRAAGREIRPEWARKVAMSLLDSSKEPVGDTAAYVTRAIQREQDLSRFLPTPTASSSRAEEAFLPDPTEDIPAPPAFTLHTTTKPRASRTPAGQPPLLASVPDVGTPPVDARQWAAEARARMEATRASGGTQ